MWIECAYRRRIIARNAREGCHKKLSSILSFFLLYKFYYSHPPTNCQPKYYIPSLTIKCNVLITQRLLLLLLLISFSLLCLFPNNKCDLTTSSSFPSPELIQLGVCGILWGGHIHLQSTCLQLAPVLHRLPSLDHRCVASKIFAEFT